MLLTDKVAIITGGGRGIGRGIASRFAQEGCSVVIADVRLPDNRDGLTEVPESGRQEGLAIPCNVSDSNQVRDMVDTVLKHFGKVDVLVNCAGVSAIARPIEDVPEDEWHRVLAINLTGVFLCCKAVVPSMKAKRGGSIINISSVAAIFPVSPRIPYVASKAGVLGITLDLALEVAAFNVRVNAILPGPIRTELWDTDIPPDANKDAYFEAVGKKVVPMQRIGTPEDIAGVALFLASDLSSFVTGSQINVGGGLPYKY
jgi:NAD(P)-dependent dehydrogenase (short-subunit alcohol dehydrogenase family)